MLTATDVSFAYDGRTVVDGVSLVARRGAIVGLLGSNGAGKTTLLSLLAGIRVPCAGKVTLDGRDVSVLPRRQVARRLSLVPQETHAAFDFTVLDVVLMGRYPHLGVFEIEGPEDMTCAQHALEATDAVPLANRRFSTLSGGEKQRVVIAAALAQLALGPLSPQSHQQDSAVILLDEPTSSLDLRHQIELVALLQQLNLALGLTIVISTHDVNLASRLCHELVLLREGRVSAYGTPRRVLTSATLRDVFDVEAEVEIRSAGFPFVHPVSARHGRA